MKKVTNWDCDICSFQNPKGATTAVIIRDQKLLVAKRNKKNEPFYRKWDFVGGFLQKKETPEQGLKREIKEELGVNSKLTFINVFPGTYQFKDGRIIPIINFAYLVEINGKIKLNTQENSQLAWVPIKSLKTIAFDSNQKILKFIKDNFAFDLKRVRELVSQLDSSAKIKEENIYKAVLNGHVSKVIQKGKLLGMGWIFPRQTLLRNQAVVEDMIVDESQRGKGLGEKIVRDLIAWARKNGVEVVELTTNPKRVAANHLYQKVGFKLHETNHYLLKLK